jgi:hypothetical protein
MSTGLLDIMKRASMDAMDNAQMCDLRYGKVVSIKPLKVQVTSLFTIPEALLVVPEHLTDHEVSVTINWNTENHTHTHSISDSYTGGGSASDNTHKHNITGKKTMTVHGALKVNDKVALLRKQGGQSYFILDRI